MGLNKFGTNIGTNFWEFLDIFIPLAGGRTITVKKSTKIL